MKHIKLFENFSWDYLKNNNKSLGDFYADKLETFDLEQTILEKLDAFETRVEEVFSDRWNLNRGRSYSNYSGDYFAINVKVHVWPSTDEVESKFGIKIDDDRLTDIWYRWLQDQAEMFEEDIKESYNWVDKISWGGNSGGWVHIYPEMGADRLLEYAEESIQFYLDVKDEFDEEELEEIAKAIDSPEWQRLSELGLVEDEESVKRIVDNLKGVLNVLTTETENLDQIEEDLKAIQRQHREFERNAEKYFMDFLAEEIEDGHISENYTYNTITTEGTISNLPGMVFRLMENSTELGVIGMLDLNNSNNLEFDYDLVDFLDNEPGPFTNENTYYLHGLFVGEEFRGRGLSKTLVNKCNEVAQKNGIKYSLLITDCTNEVAQNLYKSLGYSVCNSTGIKDLLYKEL